MHVLPPYRSPILGPPAVQILQDMVAQHQERRSKITDETVKQFTTPRKMSNLFGELKLDGN